MMDNTISDRLRDEGKKTYTILFCVVGPLTLSLSAAVGCAIRYAPSGLPYWAGACACAVLMIGLTFCVARTYILIQGVTEHNKDSLGTMLTVSLILGMVCTMASIAGSSVSANLGLIEICSPDYGDFDSDGDEEERCVNETENRIISSVIIGLCVAAFFVAVLVIIISNKTKKNFHLQPTQRFRQVQVTFQQQQQQQFQQQQFNQRTNAGEGGYNWGQFQSQPYQGSNPGGFQQPPPPPTYTSAQNPSMYPMYPPNQQTQYGVNNPNY